MKKIALIALAAMLTGAAFAQEKDYSAKTWTNDIGISLSVPVMQYKVDGNTIKQWAISFDAMYMGVHKNGFTVKASTGGGTANSGSITFGDDDDSPFGSFVRGDLGAGYSFVHDNGFTFSALAMFGVEAATYETKAKSYTHPYFGDVDRSYTAALVGITLGADITAAWYTKEHFGYFVNIAARYIPLAGLVSGTKYEDGDLTYSESLTSTGHGLFSITPACGVLWRF
ncbi:MAG: hypothetical protein K6G80_11105 [Treponema sp.]|nr:hypothetical protein [Treponema sp.]